MTAPAQFFPVWISTRAGNSGPPIVWGDPCGTPSEAKHLLQAMHRRGDISLGFVVRKAGGERDVLHGYTVPASAEKIIQHLLAVEEMLDNPPV